MKIITKSGDSMLAGDGFRVFEPVFGPASYHLCDYSFFYLNIRENARVRAEAWSAKKRHRDLSAAGLPSGSGGSFSEPEK